MKTIMLLGMLVGLVGCAESVSFEPEEEECDCEAEELSEECSEECEVPEEEPVTNEGASCKAEIECTPGLWCVITPETGPTEGVCTVVP